MGPRVGEIVRLTGRSHTSGKTRKEKVKGMASGLKEIGPARWPIRFGLVAQENGRLGTRLGGLARAAARKGGSRTRRTGHGRPITSFPPLLFFAGGFLGRRGTGGPFLLPSLLLFTGEPGPHSSASSSSLLHSSPLMDLGRGAWSGTAWRGLLGGGSLWRGGKAKPGRHGFVAMRWLAHVCASTRWRL